MALGTRHVAPGLLDKVNKALGITVLDQWYYVSNKAVSQAIGARTLNNFGGTSGFLQSAYPLHQFDQEKLASRRNQERDQNFIEVVIRKLFPNTEIHTKARKAVGIINPETDAYLEIDFWIPSLKLGIEYQDKHHYEYQWYANAALEEYQKRDNIKRVAMSSLGYTLINIGFWWDKSPESLAATIRNYRPDLLQEYEYTLAEPIPSDPPPGYFTNGIPGVAGLMSPFIPSINFNPINWYAGEKHDGVRGVFNPKLYKMFSRSGNELSVIPSLLADIPNMLVEGEIIAGRNNYSKTVAVSYHTHPDKVDWPVFRYVVYDIPDAELGNYMQRYSAITNELTTYPFIFAQLAFRVLVISKTHLKMLVDATIGNGGEGMIVQQDAQYEYGRAKSLAKIKVRRDADAQVLHIHKHSCTCKLISGATADITFRDNFDPNELKNGDVVSYYHNGYSKDGKPKQGEIYKVRYDIIWEKLTSESLAVGTRSVEDAVGGGSLTSHRTARNRMGYWNKSRNVRAFFDNFSRKARFDALVPENWYLVRTTTLRNAGGGGLLNAFNYSLLKALTCAYPELKFEADRFRTHDSIRARSKMGHWQDSMNVRTFFDEFARTSGLDPNVPENWYTVSPTTIWNAGGSGLLKAYNFNLKKALSRAYPEAKFEAEKFIVHANTTDRTKGHWNKVQNVREFLDDFSRKAGFDPLVPKNWYLVRTTALRTTGGGGLLNAYRFSLQKALSCAYPELTFEKEKFRTHDKTRVRNTIGYWNDPSNVRTFLDQFAQTSGFDPLVAENWYRVKIISLRSSGGSGLLNAYRFDVKKALACAYPELKLDLRKFRTCDRTKGGQKLQVEK